MKNTTDVPPLKKPFKILLAEDDEDEFFLFNLALSSLHGSFNILHTYNGVMLSSLIQSGARFNAIFLDINMPYKNGITCLKEIRNIGAFDLTKIVMYTTSESVKDIDACFCAGANFYLIKSGNYSTGLERLKSLFSNFYFNNNQATPRSFFVIEAGKEKAMHLLQNKWDLHQFANR